MNEQQVAANAINLTLFTSKNDVREYCQRPIRLADGRVAATDGFSAIMLDAYDGDASALLSAPDGVENAIKRMTDGSEARQWVPLASLKLPPPEKCRTCKGHGHLVETECDDCGGYGEFDHGRHTYECKECDGDGVTQRSPAKADSPGAKPCLSCRGTGYEATYGNFFELPGMQKGFGCNAVLLARFPSDGEFAVDPYDGSKGILLRGNGWRGVLMPMRG